MRIGPFDAAPYTIVGVANDVKQVSLALNAGRPDARQRAGAGHGDSAGDLVGDKDQPVVRIARPDDLVAASAASHRFALLLFEAFALAAVLLAAAGIYGVLAGSVAERTREIGVRAALGASRPDILTLVLRQALTLTGVGVAVGLAAAIGATGAITAMLFGISARDPITYTSVVVLLTAVAAMGSGVPAWRAVRVDPVTTLRAD